MNVASGSKLDIDAASDATGDSNLTWRDSKAAIVCFVTNKELNHVLEQIATGTPQHPCFVRLESKKAESWMQFEFRLKSDATRNVHLAVLCFHFPPG